MLTEDGEELFADFGPPLRRVQHRPGLPDQLDGFISVERGMSLIYVGISPFPVEHRGAVEPMVKRKVQLRLDLLGLLLGALTLFQQCPT